jgi:hypothetical protein
MILMSQPHFTTVTSESLSGGVGWGEAQAKVIFKAPQVIQMGIWAWDPQESKCALKTDSISVTPDLLEMQTLRPCPDLLSQHLHFSKIPGRCEVY